MLAAWHASLEVGHPIANKEFLVGVFPSLGENRREALKIAAGFRGEEAFDAGVAEEQALETVLPWLSRGRADASSPRECARAVLLGPARLRELTAASRRERRLDLADRLRRSSGTTRRACRAPRAASQLTSHVVDEQASPRPSTPRRSSVSS